MANGNLLQYLISRGATPQQAARIVAAQASGHAQLRAALKAERKAAK